MGACFCQDRNSSFIDSKLRENEKYEKTLIKLLFLGPGGSGKSTIFKQLRWLHGNGFSEKDIFKTQIYLQISSQMQDAIRHYLQTQIEDEKLEKAIATIKDCDSTQKLTNEIVADIQYIWQNDSRLKGIFQKYHSNKILAESTEYFWNSIERISSEDYEPNKEDIINIRNRSTGINEKKFKIKECNFHIFDAGGQKSERKKWIKCFDNVRAVIFVVSLSSYNEMMFEDVSKHKMTDALELFDKIINNDHFAETNIILFLNKKDLFQKKILDLPLTICPAFANFGKETNPVYLNNNPHDYFQTTSFIIKKFEKVNGNEKRKMYTHLTCAMDDKNVDDVFGDIVRIVKSGIKMSMSSNLML